MAKKPGKRLTVDELTEIVVGLTQVFRTAQEGELRLRSLANKVEATGQSQDAADLRAQADKIWEKNRVLGARIDVLIGQQMSNWQGSAADVTQQLTVMKGKADAAVEVIKQNQQMADEVVKAIGALDTILGLALSLAAKIA
jgi:hypothetical protein